MRLYQNPKIPNIDWESGYLGSRLDTPATRLYRPSAGALYAAVCDAYFAAQNTHRLLGSGYLSSRLDTPATRLYRPSAGALYAAVCDAILLRKIRIARFAMAIAIKDQSSGAK